MTQSEGMFEGAWVNSEGRIVSTLRCSAGHEDQQSKTGCVLVPGVFDPDATYFVEGKPTERPGIIGEHEQSITADAVETLSIKVPVGTEVRRSNAIVGIATDGLFEFRTTVPGVYEFELLPPFPWRPTTIKVTANAG